MAAVALDQVRGGANLIDVNMDEGMLDSERVMTDFMNYIATEPEIARSILRDASRAVWGAGGLDDDRLASVLDVQVYPALVRIVVLVVIPVVDLVIEVQADAANQRVSRRRRDALGEKQERPLHKAQIGEAL
jgi:hypothetical protein